MARTKICAEQKNPITAKPWGLEIDEPHHAITRLGLFVETTSNANHSIRLIDESASM
jgi:hypothetical protein